jgi:hypothetical protein
MDEPTKPPEGEAPPAEAGAPPPPPEPEFVVDEKGLQQHIERLKSEQRLGFGLLAGAAAAVLCAFVWGGITAATRVQIGWMAVGVGFAVGFAVRTFGKGIDRYFGLVGAGMALVGCLLGNLLAAVMMFSISEGAPFFTVLSNLTPEVAFEILKATFHPMDVLFYGIALYGGYQVSFRKVTQEELARFVRPKVGQ